MIVAGSLPKLPPEPDIPQVGGWVGIVEGNLLLVRTYADDTLTAAIHDGHRFGPEVVLTPEQVTA